MATKKPMGRPSKYKPEYCDMLINHCTAGLSFESFAGVVNTCIDTLYEWERVHSEFSYAKKEANAKCRIFWENIGIRAMAEEKDAPKINSAIWIFNMKNRFKWKDRTEIEETSKQSIKHSIDPETEKSIIEHAAILKEFIKNTKK